MEELKGERLIALNWGTGDPEKARHNKELNSGPEWYIDEADEIKRPRQVKA